MKKQEEDRKFIENLPRKSTPFLHENDRIYDISGDLIWDKVRGCVGPSTYVKIDKKNNICYNTN